MRIGLDVMGGDHGPQVIIDGAYLALQGNPSIAELLFVGDQAQIQAALDQAQCRDPRIRIVHASEVMTMEDNPLAAVRKKKDCSMARAMDLLKDGQIDAVISAGNTGGLVATASVKLHRLEGVERPSIATTTPTAESQFVLLDGGATPECKPVHLLQF